MATQDELIQLVVNNSALTADEVENMSDFSTLKDHLRSVNPDLLGLVTLLKNRSRIKESQEENQKFQEGINEIKADGVAVIDRSSNAINFETLSDKIQNNNFVIFPSENLSIYNANNIETENHIAPMVYGALGRRPFYVYQPIIILRENGNFEFHLRETPMPEQFSAPKPILLDERFYQDFKKLIDSLSNRLSDQKESNLFKEFNKLYFSKDPNRKERIKEFFKKIRQAAGDIGEIEIKDEIPNIWYAPVDVGDPFQISMWIGNREVDELGEVQNKSFISDIMDLYGQSLEELLNFRQTSSISADFDYREVSHNFVDVNYDARRSIRQVSNTLDNLEDGVYSDQVFKDVDRETKTEEELVDEQSDIMGNHLESLAENLQIIQDEAEIDPQLEPPWPTQEEVEGTLEEDPDAAFYDQFNDQDDIWTIDTLINRLYEAATHADEIFTPTSLLGLRDTMLDLIDRVRDRFGRFRGFGVLLPGELPWSGWSSFKRCPDLFPMAENFADTLTINGDFSLGQEEPTSSSFKVATKSKFQELKAKAEDNPAKELTKMNENSTHVYYLEQIYEATTVGDVIDQLGGGSALNSGALPYQACGNSYDGRVDCAYQIALRAEILGKDVYWLTDDELPDCVFTEDINRRDNGYILSYDGGIDKSEL